MAKDEMIAAQGQMEAFDRAFAVAKEFVQVCADGAGPGIGGSNDRAISLALHALFAASEEHERTVDTDFPMGLGHALASIFTGMQPPRSPGAIRSMLKDITASTMESVRAIERAKLAARNMN